MKQINLWIISLFFFLSIAAVAQKKTTKKPAAKKPEVTKSTAEKKADPVADEKKVRDMIAFLEFMLNTLGSSSTPIRDKEVLITESYSKIFRDSKVQVEDDLDEERKVITNKDVVAYLKDVNFFFQNVRFEFTIEEITGSTMPDGQYFYKVTTTRNLKGTSSDQKSVNSTLPRYIEINYNPKDQDLKIVSIYTHEFDERQALLSWWKDLSYEWQSIFSKKLTLGDSVNLSDIKKIIDLGELDLSHNQYIQTLEPLSPLLSLNKLDLSGTTVGDLTPIRNLTELVDLNISNTRVKDLSPLKYSNKLERLVINNTEVSNLAVLEKMPALQILEMRETPINDFAPITKLTQLQIADLNATQISNLSFVENLLELTELNISSTLVNDLNPLKALKNLQILNMDSTRIKSISSLSSLESLKVLYASHTEISDLTPLQKLTQLEKIYCDQTLIKSDVADAFMIANPKVLVIFDSKDLKAWWDTLSAEWQEIFIKAARIGESPSIEELAKIPLLDSINITGKSRIDNLEPLRQLQRLKVVLTNRTSITDLSPLRGHKEIHSLDISETGVSDLSFLNHFKELKVLKADRSKIENIELLLIPGLEKCYVDQTSVNNYSALQFLEKNPTCLLIYKTDILNRWWNNLDDNWRNVFKDQLGAESKITSENLHHLVEQESLHFKDAPVSNLSPLSEFVRLKDLRFSGTAMTSLSPVENIKSLKSLHATNSPIQKIDSLSRLIDLEDLDISNTPIEDVYVIWKLKKLTKFNCAGTQIKRLDALEKLERLEYLDCSNTNVSKLSPLDYLPLKTLKCFNTKVSSKAIENFKASHPECNVIYYR